MEQMVVKLFSLVFIKGAQGVKGNKQKVILKKQREGIFPNSPCH